MVHLMRISSVAKFTVLFLMVCGPVSRTVVTDEIDILFFKVYQPNT